MSSLPSLPSLPSVLSNVPPVTLPEAVVRASQGDTVLTSWPTAAAAGLLALAVTVAVVAILRRRRRRTRGSLPRLLGGSLLIVLAWSCAVLLGLNAGFKVVPDFSALQRETDSLLGNPVGYRTLHGGHVREVNVPGNRQLAVPASTAWIYTPPGFDSSGATRYPVAYLIHGYPGDSSNWFTLGKADLVFDALIRSKTIPPMIVVAPDVNGGGLRDSECLDDRRGPKVESWLYRDLIPYIDNTQPTRADRSHRVIAGFSAGAFCALDQALRHQHTWGAAVSIEPYGEPGDGALAMLGSAQEVAAHSPIHYLPTMTFDAPLPVYLAAGSVGIPPDTVPLAHLLSSRGQPVLFREEPGEAHTWELARTALPYGLAFAARELHW